MCFSILYSCRRFNKMKFMCENLTLIMNLHSFCFGGGAHTFRANSHPDLSICTDFQHPEKVQNQFLAVFQTLVRC